jgi:hypothetical protein
VTDPTDIVALRDAIRRLILRATCTTGFPEPGTAAWWAVPACAQLACVAVWGYPVDITPPNKRAATEISAALNWATVADQPSHAELVARRAVPVTPVRCSHLGCREVVSVQHPLPPDLGTVRCPRHTNSTGVAA